MVVWTTHFAIDKFIGFDTHPYEDIQFNSTFVNGHAGQEPIDWRYLPFFLGPLT